MLIICCFAYLLWLQFTVGFCPIYKYIKFGVNQRFTSSLCPFSHCVELQVRAATGGLWKFPLKFVATEPQVDDTIIIEATGLGKDSSVGFRLTSQAKYVTLSLYNYY